MGVVYTWYNEWQEVEVLEADNKQIDSLRKEINNIHTQLIEFSLLGETILDMYVDNIRQSSERMREMLNTLPDLFRLDNGKEQSTIFPCRISAITHILETEFMPLP